MSPGLSFCSFSDISLVCVSIIHALQVQCSIYEYALTVSVSAYLQVCVDAQFVSGSGFASALIMWIFDFSFVHSIHVSCRR